MKSCPTCNRTYPDDTLAFCLVDGSVLSAPFDPQTKAPYRYNAESSRTELFPTSPKRSDTVPSPPVQPTMPAFPPLYGGAPQSGQPKRSAASKTWIAVAAVVFLFLLGGIALVLTGRRLLDNRNPSEKAATKSEALPAPTKTPQSWESIATPESSPSPLKLDVAGTWIGVNDESPATLIINSSEDDSYEGIEIVSASVRVKIAVKVKVDSRTRHITINETRLIDGSPGAWNLGVNTGSISSDGNKISGRATDVKGKKYAWSFSRQ